MQRQKVKLLLTKPAYIGFFVLELRKLHMMRYNPFLFPFFSNLSFPPVSFFPVLYHFIVVIESSLSLHTTIHNTTTPIYRFHLDVTKKKYGKEAQHLFTVSDSVMSHVETADIYKELVESKDLYVLSNFKPTNPYYQPVFAANKEQLLSFYYKT